MANKDGSKSGGREKGTPNKKSLDAQALAERLGVDPLEVLLHFAAGDERALGFEGKFRDGAFGRVEVVTITPEMRISAAAAASRYLYPQRKAVELKDSDGNSMPMVVFSLPPNGREKKD